MLGLRESYRNTCQAKRALGLVFASLLLLTQVDPAPAIAAISDDFLEPIQHLDRAEDDKHRTIEQQRHPLAKYPRGNIAKPQHDSGLVHSSEIGPTYRQTNEKLDFFYTSSKFATFDLKLRKSRDPPNHNL